MYEERTFKDKSASPCKGPLIHRKSYIPSHSWYSWLLSMRWLVQRNQEGNLQNSAIRGKVRTEQFGKGYLLLTEKPCRAKSRRQPAIQWQTAGVISLNCPHQGNTGHYESAWHHLCPALDSNTHSIGTAGRSGCLVPRDLGAGVAKLASLNGPLHWKWEGGTCLNQTSEKLSSWLMAITK